MMPLPEFSRLLRTQDIGTAVRAETPVATAAECAALAARFDLLALDVLRAELTLVREAGGVRMRGRLHAAGAQACSLSREPVPFVLDEPIDLSFSAAATPAADELELVDADLDTVPLDGDVLDVGEVVAQEFGLALDPYPRAPAAVRAEAARFVISEEEAAARAAADKAAANPFGVLRR